MNAGPLRRTAVAFALAFAATAALAQQVPNAAVGFKTEGVYDLGQFDDISLYSGQLSLSVLLGPSFPRNAGRSLQLQLTYLSSAWDYLVHTESPGNCRIDREVVEALVLQGRRRGDGHLLGQLA